MSDLLLRVDNIHVSYGRVAVLHGVSISVRAGEVVALVGANGAGKTTLLRTISGLLRPRQGRIEFGDKRIDHWSADAIVRNGIAHVPEGRRVFPSFTVVDNLRAGAFSRVDQSEVEADIEAALEAAPILKLRAKTPAGSLSGGEQQLLAIHRALMSKPKMMLLDEPSMGLSPVLVDAVWEMVTKLNVNEGMTVLLVEQNAFGALEIASRAYVLSAGEVIMGDESQVLLDRPDFATAYLGGGGTS